MLFINMKVGIYNYEMRYAKIKLKIKLKNEIKNVNFFLSESVFVNEIKINIKMSNKSKCKVLGVCGICVSVCVCLFREKERV